MKWTLDDYLNQPQWFIEEIIRQVNRERSDQERANRRTQ